MRELQIIHEHDGIKEIKYTAEENSLRALELIEEVLTLQQQFKNSCPYSFQYANNESLPADLLEEKIAEIKKADTSAWLKE